MYWLIAGTDSEAAHQLLCCFLQHLTQLTFTLLLQLLLSLNTHVLIIIHRYTQTATLTFLTLFLTLLAKILRSRVTANITGRALKTHRRMMCFSASLTVTSLLQECVAVCTHQFSSFWDWKALKKDVRGQGATSTDYWLFILAVLCVCTCVSVCVSTRIPH